MPLELTTHANFDPGAIEALLQARGWKTERVPASNFDLVRTDPGAALECGDGRFANISKRRKHGPRIFGGTNALAALKYGGDPAGFNASAAKLLRLGYSTGLHSDEHSDNDAEADGCGLYGLWRRRQLESAVFPLDQAHRKLAHIRFSPGEWAKLHARKWNGKHFKLPGEHQEQALRFNGFIDTTPKPDKAFFDHSHWLFQKSGISEDRGINFVAETVEKLAPQSTLALIII